MIKLDGYQLDAVERLKNGAILCGDVGSGKSLTGLAYYFCRVCGGMIDGMDYGYDEDYVPMSNPKDLYIITTAHKRDTLEWEGELGHFLLSTHPEVSLYGHDIKIVVDSWNNIKKYSDVKNAFFLFDEQRVVGSGVWVNSFLKIAKRNQWILLTATPGDTWMDYIPVFIANGFYRNRTDFIGQHVVYNAWSKYRRVERYLEERRLERLRDSILVDMDYTSAHKRHFYLKIAQYDRELYKKIAVRRWNVYKECPIKNAGEYCYLCRKAVNTDPSRIEILKEILEEHPRLVVFYTMTQEIEMLRNTDFGSDIQIGEYNGERHDPLPDGNRWLYFVQYTAGAEGWNCTTTDTMVFFSQQYSYKALEQAMGRIDRRTSPYSDLHYYIIRSAAPIDLGIQKALKGKKTFSEARYYNQVAKPIAKAA